MTHKIIIIYHKDCPDGFGGGWAAWKKFGHKAEYIGAKHGDPIAKNLAGRNVYIIDFSYSKLVIEKVLRDARSLAMIDHHVSARDVVKSVPDHLYAINRSGAALAWQYFHPRKKIPKLLLHIEDVDLWKFKLPKTKEIICMLESQPYNFKVWDKIARDLENTKAAAKYIRAGKAILDYKMSLVAEFVSKADKAVFSGYKALVVNAGVFNSEIGNELIKLGAQVGIVYSEQGGRRKVSLRSGNNNVDVSKMAQKFGGGGHRRAAGFSIPMHQKASWKIIES
ncbi:MAG: hypothetical protein A3B23_00525 [Candidatus Colwellbacteria bacterium RIFCSPLOWO2_01_FULL_48_10]|uniref:DHHA1 domain-containing protein n=1 Tax=Candidatus Colwellbacteria bacterium RIFCSPLOWO2_01_FULL_48_10 TaxID=1797690 RepID=A0A1G1Z407_9BACT|nr:MAG: hypothetical protein A3B23_00525 [Candidatus Colwellbacteria bacterium RIFCSPLOWO2_01_FULL_48_10]